MKENGLYTIKKEYFEIMNKIGQSETNGGHRRPVYCCIEDNKIKGLYWAIPTSDYAHRTPAQKVKIGKFINLPTKDLRSSYYHLAKTTKDAVYKISSVFPVTDKYIDHEFVTQGVHVVMKKRKNVDEINRKLKRILSMEFRNRNFFPQHISDIKDFLLKELEL